MSRPNGHARPDSQPLVDQTAVSTSLGLERRESRWPADKVKQLVAQLEVPFDTSAIEWRVTNTAQDGKRGQVVPYADPRAYTDRLNLLLSPAGWTRKYTVNTSANFERAKDKKIVAKVLVTCELTIFGLGTHSATGEEWGDCDFACTSAEAQAFKRSCACFGLGRYLYYFRGAWVDLDERKRPKIMPRLFDWATPEGWRTGQRPSQADSREAGPIVNDVNAEKVAVLVHEIEEMAHAIGKRLYRGVLKTIARVWNPTDIHDPIILQSVLNEMRAADTELHRLDAALNQIEPGTLIPILRSLGLSSLEQVNRLDDLRKIICEVERAAGIDTMDQPA